MKFFSNEAKENSDDRDRTDDDVNAVPQQRAGSPWGDAPRDADDEHRDTTSPADAAAVPAPDVRPWSSADDASTTSSTAPTTTYGPDSTVADRSGSATSSDAVDLDLDADRDRKADENRDRPTETRAVQDDGTFDSPKAVEPATGEPLSTDSGDSSTGSTGHVADTHAGAAAVPVHTQPVTTPEGDKAHAGDATPVVAAAAVPPTASAGTASASSASDRLFPDGDSFNERFRDIQLRFVDSPKEATAEAAALVNEAVDKLTSNLRSQRDSLTGGSDDTEKLRVELRAYRDLLNRLVNL